MTSDRPRLRLGFLTHVQGRADDFITRSSPGDVRRGTGRRGSIRSARDTPPLGGPDARDTPEPREPVA